MAPKGMSKELYLKHMFDNDDDFFHISCHVDSNLKCKIEKGEFVDLEKLLPRDRGGFMRLQTEADKAEIEIVTRSGRTFLAPPQNGAKINGVRRWDQAFRIYSMVYCQANPDRSGEILQYMDVIHGAAMNYSWENVAQYDYMFRQLMAAKPWRSWAKTYSQGWNVSLKAQNFNSHQGNNRNRNRQISNNSNSHANSNGNNVRSSSSRVRTWRDNCCWKFNKNKCKKRSNECDYDHKCTYCGGSNHGYYNCRKRNKSNKEVSSLQSRAGN